MFIYLLIYHRPARFFGLFALNVWHIVVTSEADSWNVMTSAGISNDDNAGEEDETGEC